MEIVYVLNQKLDIGEICTSVFKNFETCIKSACNEIGLHDNEHDLVKAENELREQLYYDDGFTKYYIEECVVNED